MNYWKQHVTSWASEKSKDPDIVEKILVKKGWDPDKYQESMEKDLRYYLDQWYILAVKALPEPATSKRRNPVYRRNADTDLRSLERRARTTGSVGDILSWATALKRAGRDEESRRALDSLIATEIDLSFLKDTKIEATERNASNSWGLGQDTITLERPVAGDYISSDDFISEWIMAEWGSFEDHEEPKEGHVVNVLQRSEEKLIIKTAKDLKLLSRSIGGCTMGLNYDHEGEHETSLEFDDGTIVDIKFSDVYGEMSSRLARRLYKLEKDFDRLTNGLEKN